MECKAAWIAFAISHVCDLIDTLWNVKGFSIVTDPVPFARFNRYIVECKEICFVLCYSRIDRFNRYIVECKVYSHGIREIDPSGDLIDTLWNVKELVDAFEKA